ncbi:histidine--tRNA ligase [Arthrobacter sp. Hiyo1]|nr:histidine--tRNA ligase [Arthrobacter sp. Hiyo1]
MARTASLSGFPEWLPQERLVELHVLDTLRKTFELHGFSSIETRAVETVGQLLRKGEIDKEVYGLSRLQEDEDGGEGGKSDKADPTLGAPLRPHGAVCPLCRRERRLPGVPVPPLPDPEGVAGGAAPGGPRPASSRRRTSTSWATASCLSATTSRSPSSSRKR